MAWDIRNLFRPIAPGVNVNPLMMIGAGMADDNMTGAFSQMGNIQMQGRQAMLNQQMLAMKQQEAERKAKQRDAMQAIAPGVAKEIFPDNPNMQGLLAMNPGLMQAAMKQRMAAGKPTSAMQNVLAYQQATPEQRAIMDKMSAFSRSPGTVVNVGQAGKFGPVPTGMQRVEAPESPTGTELLAEPGSPEQKKAKQAADKLEMVQFSLDSYRSVLGKYGVQAMPGAGKDILKAAHTDLLLQLKELNELGALAGPDYQLMLDLIKEPTSISAEIREMFGGTAGFSEQLDLVQKKLDAAKALASGQPLPEQPAAPGGQAEQDPAIQQLLQSLPPGTRIINVEP